jgi:DNA polymerase III delta prime subunit
MRDLETLKLSKTQEMLLKKLVDMNSMWDYDSKIIRNNIYNLFFDWKVGDPKKEEQLDEQKDDGSNADDQGVDAEQDLAEKKMRAQIRLDQELFEFEERGGFP